MATPLVRIRGLEKAYTQQTPSFCAQITDLTLYPGESLGITGPSGCGKSTLLEMLVLLTKPDQMDAYVLRTETETFDIRMLWEQNPARLALLRRRFMGFVHQAGGLYPFLRCKENISLPLLLNGMGSGAASGAVSGAVSIDGLIEFLGLGHVKDALPEQLSYGERQRTAIARALVHRPRLIVADEPTSALDPASALAAMQLLREGAQRTGASLLVVSHDHTLLTTAGIPCLAMEPARDADASKRQYVLDGGRPDGSSEVPSDSGKSYGGAERSEATPWWVPLYLAWRDFWYEYAISLCAIFAFAAALTPLIVLGGLRNGVITTLTERFLHNPASLAVNPYGSRRYSDADIKALAGLPDVTFIVPCTRTLASAVTIPRKDRPPVVADTVPTAPSDPLLARYTVRDPGDGEAVVSQELARSLFPTGSPPVDAAGSVLTLLVNRRVQGREEKVLLLVRVVGVLPDAADWKAHVYLPLPLLLDIEQYRDGFAVPSRGWEGEDAPKGSRSYAGFRMYVKDPDAVLRIRDELKRRGIDAWTAAKDVEAIQGVERALTLVTLLVGCVTLAGMAFSLASLAVGNVRRKARLIAQGRLMGLTGGEIVSFPFVQMAVTAAAAASCSLGIYALVAALLNWAASPWLEAAESACRLDAVHLVCLYTGSFLISVLSALAASFSLLSLQPAEVLRRDM